MTKRILCAPAVDTPIRAELDKYRGVALLEGEFAHTTMPYKVKATRSYLDDMAAKWNAHRMYIEVPTPEGHTTESSKNRGYLDRDGEARVIELDVNGEKRAALELPFDIRDPETKRAAAAGTLGRSVGIEDDFRYSTPDGKVHHVGEFLNHVAFTSYPIVANMPPLEPVREMGKDGQEFEFVSLGADTKGMASRVIMYQDPPKEVAHGQRKATHDECGYTAGTTQQNCRRCIAYINGAYNMETGEFGKPSCYWVDNPILDPNVCKYFREDTTFSKQLTADGADGVLVLANESQLELAKLAMAKNRNKYSSKQQAAIDSAITAAEKKFKVASNEEEGELDMDVKQLAKELGVAETDDVKAFARSVAEAAEKRVADSVNQAIIAFAKTGFGVTVTDVAKAAETIKAELSKPAAEASAQLSKLTTDLAAQQEQVKNLAKENEEAKKALSDLRTERTVSERQNALKNRIMLAKADRKMVKADEERILTIATEGEQPVTISLNFSKDAKYDAAWDKNMFRAEVLMEEIERRPKDFAIKGEATKKNLSRFEQDPATIDDGSDTAKKDAEAGRSRADRFKPKKAA